VSKSDGTKAPKLKLKKAGIVKDFSKNKSAKLKLSSWYERAARSFGISSKTLGENRDEASD
jgi:hypothetical protein